MIRTLVGVFGVVAALVIALSIPVGYGLTRYFNEIDSLDLKARINALKIEQFIRSDPDLWQFRSMQLVKLLEFTGSPEDRVR